MQEALTLSRASEARCADHEVSWRQPAHAEPKRRTCMKGVVFLGDRRLELRDFPDPTPGARDVVLEIKASGMCGSDLHVYRASFKPGDTTSGFGRGAEPVMGGHAPG